jgi:hypothetical protein
VFAVGDDMFGGREVVLLETFGGGSADWVAGMLGSTVEFV